MKVDKNYLAFKKWYSSNKDIEDKEKLARGAWEAAMELISSNYEIEERKIKQDYYLE